jgi:hypothetical protein
MPPCKRMSEKLPHIRVLESGTGDRTVKFEPGDHVKFEIKDEKTGEAEWMWLRVDYCDEPNKMVFGWLDSQPIVFTPDMKLGQHLAVSYNNIREHKKATDF